MQHVDLVAALRERGMSYEAAVAFLDTSPELAFSVWCHCGSHLPSTWHRGYAVVMLDNGDEASTSVSAGRHIIRSALDAVRAHHEGGSQMAFLDICYDSTC